jgi:uncharacterized BrkB/YihY/UPF0761 family membrane protein
VWFYILALIVLAGAVVNELRFETLREPFAESAGSPERPAATLPPAAPAPKPVSKETAGRPDGGTGERES